MHWNNRQWYKKMRGWYSALAGRFPQGGRGTAACAAELLGRAARGSLTGHPCAHRSPGSPICPKLVLCCSKRVFGDRCCCYISTQTSSPCPSCRCAATGFCKPPGREAASRQRSTEFHPHLCIRCVFKGLLSYLIRCISLGKCFYLPNLPGLAFPAVCAQRMTMAGMCFIPSAREGKTATKFRDGEKSVRAPSTSTTRWHCVPALHSSFNF